MRTVAGSALRLRNGDVESMHCTVAVDSLCQRSLLQQPCHLTHGGVATFTNDSFVTLPLLILLDETVKVLDAIKGTASPVPK